MPSIDENIYDKLSNSIEVSQKFEHIANVESKVEVSKSVISSGVRMVGNNDSLFDSLSKANLSSSKSKIDVISTTNDYDFLSK